MVLVWKLPAHAETTLLQQPESGMGFQIVKARLQFERHTLFVFNVEVMLTTEELLDGVEWSDDVSTVIPNDFEFDRVLSIREFEAEEAPETAQGIDAVLWALRLPAPPSALAPTALVTRTTSGREGFLRYSAFPRDKRIGADGSLQSGTYATTVSDARFAVSGLAAAGRYALPNPSPAVHVFTIVPPPGVSYRAGTARPAFGQAGGGVEVFFASGSGPGSAFRPYDIPER